MFKKIGVQTGNSFVLLKGHVWHKVEIIVRHAPPSWLVVQEIAATTDGLWPLLTSFFLNKPNEDDEYIDERDIVLYNNLCKVCSANSNKLS